MPAHVIDKGLASHRLLAHVLVAKYADHLPLYRRQKRFAREGITLPLSTLADWQGKLITDDYSGYKQSFKQGGITEIACMAHARRKFYELHVANQSEIAAQALASFKALYAIEAEAKDLTAKEREQRRQEKARPILEKLHDWMLAQRTLVPDGSGTAKALDYSLKRWAALTRYLEDGCVPIDNNHIEQQIRPLA